MDAQKGDERQHALADFARAGFQELTRSREQLLLLSDAVDVPVTWLLRTFSVAADPDIALARTWDLVERHPEIASALDREQAERLARLIGSSPGLGDFFTRNPDRLGEILARGGRLFTAAEAREALVTAVEGCRGENGWNALRVRYRELLAEVMLLDLMRSAEGEALEVFESVAAALAGLAEAALEAALHLARATVASGESGVPVAPERLEAVSLSIIGMGKCGAGELNVVSDVDVMFIAETSDDTIVGDDAMIRIATRLASEVMRSIQDPALEPPLWQVDANLRPEGRHGPLVRTLGSMLNYYERWAKAWEFQALLKARTIAGDRRIGDEFVERTRSMVWASSSREDFVGSVQRMRQRVTEHIPDGDLEVQIKLGPGGLRDIEFSVQLLQLVHGQYDDRLHLSATLPALRALVEGGYVARSDGERLATDYRVLRVLEHRLQLRELRRTAIIPLDHEGLRMLARSSGLAPNGSELRRRWERTKLEVRDLHLKIFYAPLLSAVAALPEEELVLGTEEARARLTSIGFRDPDGAMRHLTALSRGTTRRARIHRNLMPVLLQWLAGGTDPDYGLLAFRRVSEANRDAPWYLRLLRDGSEAAERLTRVLSSSKFAADLLESIPDAVAWLEDDARLRPQQLQTLLQEMRALASRRDSMEACAVALRIVHRREILRVAMGRLVGVIDEDQVSEGLDAAHTAVLDGLLLALRRSEAPEESVPVELALIGMGRYGGRELGFASDIDVIAVFRAPSGIDGTRATKTAERLIAELRRHISDPRFPVDLDFGLRPEGKNGPFVRSLESYRSYYQRWSLAWEAQALLRARPVAGDAGLGADFVALADEIRYPSVFGEHEVREIRRMKARVEAERMPQGMDRRRHLKLGPGGISDVEWLAQLIQLRDGAAHPPLQTVSTLGALAAAVELDLLDEESREQLEESWRLASEIRSAIKLWSARSSNALPVVREDLEGIAGILDFDSTTALEESWLAASRRARTVFERDFFGFTEDEDRFDRM